MLRLLIRTGLVLLTFGAAAVVAQSSPSSTCTLDAPLSCAFTDETSMQSGTNCDITVKANTGAGYGLGHTTGTNYSYARCVTSNSYTATVPASFQASIRSFITMTSYDPSASSSTNDATVEIVLGNSGQVLTLGRLRAGVNTLVMPNVSQVQPAGLTASQYLTLPKISSNPNQVPNNGGTMCNGTFSWQVWSVASYRNATVTAIRIRDGTGLLHVHSVTVDACSNYAFLENGLAYGTSVDAQVELDSGPTGTNTFTTTVGQQATSAGACQYACGATTDCASFTFAPPSKCTFARRIDLVTYSASNVINIFGFPTLPAPLSTTTISTVSVSSIDAVKITKPAYFPTSRYASYLVPRIAGDNDLPMSLPFDTVTAVSIGAAQVAFASRFLSSWMTGVIKQCGGGGTPFNEGVGLSGSCSTFQYCPPMPVAASLPAGTTLTVAMPVFSAVMVNNTVTQNATSCAGSLMASAAMIQYVGAAQIGPRYFFAVQAATTASVSILQALAVERHTAAVYDWTTILIDTAINLYRYSVNSSVPLQTAPSWRFPDADGAMRSTTIMAEFRGPLGYQVVPNNAGDSTKAYNCGSYSTFDAIVMACEQSLKCGGFTMVSDGTSDAPGCLLSSGSTASTATQSTTLYVRQGGNMTFTVPILNSGAVTVRVSNFLPGAQVFIAVDGVQVATCNTSAIKYPLGAASSCASFGTCYSGSITASGTSLTITALATAPYKQTCARTAFAALIDFDPNSVVYQQQTGCVNALDVNGINCASASTSMTTCASQAFSGITISGGVSYCSVNSGSTYVEYTLANNPATIFTVTDLSALGSLGRGADVAVYGVATGGTDEVLLGRIFTSSSNNQVWYSPAGLAARISQSLCTDTTTRLTSPAGAFQAFPVPSYLRTLGIVSIRFRGPGARIVSVSQLESKSTCSAYPVWASNNDTYYRNVMPGITFGASPIATLTGAIAWADCASSCAGSANCRAWSYYPSKSVASAFTCLLQGGATSLSYTDPTTAAVVAGINQYQQATRRFVSPSTVSSVSSFLQQSSISTASLFYQPQGSSETHLGVNNATVVRVALIESGFNSSSVIAIASPGGTVTCGGSDSYPFNRLSTPTVCGSLVACPAIATPYSWFGELYVFPTVFTPQSSCNSSTWGIVATDGKVTGLLSYYRGAVYTTVTTQLSATEGSASDAINADLTNIVLDDVNALLLLYRRQADGDSSATPTLSATRTSAFCDVHSLQSYDVLRNTDSTPTSYGCSTATSINDAIGKCNADSTCAGFTIGTSDNPLCFVTSTTSTTSTTGVHLFVKRSTATCTVNLASPGVLQIRMSQGGLSKDVAGATVTVNGNVFRVCGGTEPFISGFTTSTQINSQCNVYRTCVDDLIVDATSVIQVTLPSSSRGACLRTFGVLFTFTATLTVSTNYIAAARALPQYRVVRVAATSSAPSVTLQTTSATQVAVLVQQDRYSCLGSCSVNYALNVSIGGVVAGRCGGVAGFADNRGLSDNCNTYLYCGPTAGIGSGIFAQSVVPAGASTISVSIVESSLYSATSCGINSDFRVVIRTDGVILSASSGVTGVRTLYGLNVPRAQLTSGNLSDTAKFQLLKSQYPQFDNASYANVLLSLQLNNDQSASFGLLPFDISTAAETSKVFSSGTYAVCYVDQLVERTAYPTCRLKVTGSSVKILVAQSAFSSYNQLVTITMGTKKVTCGGDNLFYGYQGVTGRCSTYFTCYTGVTPSTDISITFSQAVITSSSCGFGAVAAVSVTDATAPTTVTCTNTAPFPCISLGTCFTLDKVCNGVQDCPDGSDEGLCNNWNFVDAQLQPSCGTAPKTYSTTSVQTCKKYAIAVGAKTYTVGAVSGCAAYTCVNFDDPVLVSTNGTSQSDISLYIQASDTSAFKYCTDALQCSNNGRVTQATPPCQCVCDAQYTGTGCSELRDISLIKAVYLVFPSGTTFNTSALSFIVSTISLNVGSTTSVTIDDVRQSPTSTSLQLGLTDTTTGTASADTYTILTQTTAAYIISVLKPYGALYLTATSVVGNEVDFTCNLQNTTAFSYFDPACSYKPQLNSTQSVVVQTKAITFTSSDQWVQVDLTAYDGTVTTVSCNASDFVQTINALQSGNCAIASTCTKLLNRVGAISANVIVSPGVNPNLQSCTSGDVFESSIVVNGYGDLPDTVIDTSSTYSTTYNGSFFLLSILLFILGGLAFLHLVLWLVCLRKRFDSLKYLGSVAGTLAFFLLVGGAVAYGFYLNSAETAFSHTLLIEEYRDEYCDQSEFAFLPFRAGTIPVNGQCHQIAVIGKAEGTEFAAATIPNGTLDIVRIKYGGTLDSCNSASYQTFHMRSCVSQVGLFTTKPAKFQLYARFVSQPTTILATRVNAISAYNPSSKLAASTTVAQVESSTSIFGTAGAATFTSASQTGSQRYPTLEDPGVIHLLVFNTTDLTGSVVTNSTDLARVRYYAKFSLSTTLFTPGYTEVIDSVPLYSDNPRPTDFENVGVLFNNYRSGLVEYSATDAYVNAYKYEGIAGTQFDLSTQGSEFLITFWTRASQSSRGVVWAMTDNWQATSGEVPTLTRLIEMIENGPDTTQWFNFGYEVYAAFYVDGTTNHFQFVYTVNGVFYSVVWDAGYIGLTRIFDGNWHFFALAFTYGSSKQEVRVYVDGQTSFSSEGWNLCLPHPLGTMTPFTIGDTVLVTNTRTDTVKTGGLLVLGYYNGGVYDFSIRSGKFPVQTITRYGADGMNLYFNIAEKESLALGVVLALVALFILCASGYEVWFFFFGVDSDVYIDNNNNKRSLSEERTFANISTQGANRGELLLQFVSPVIGVCQSMALYLIAWPWPADFVSNYGTVYSVLSLELFNFVPNVPVLLAPGIQFALSIVSLFAMVILAVRDEEVYQNIIQAYRNRTRVADRNLTRKLELNRPKPEYNWVTYDENGDKVQLDAEQQDFLLRGLHDLLTSSHRKAKNMRLHSKTMLKFPGVGNGILLYERRDGDIGIFFRVSRDQGLQDADLVEGIANLQSDRITMTQIALECISPTGSVICPQHDRRLLKAHAEGLSCVHNESAYYRSVECDPKAQMYQCPEDDCLYAVCEDCWKHGSGTGDGALTGALSTLADVRRKGLWKAASTFFILIALLMYLPVTKNAMLILVCDTTYACEFGSCWNNPSMQYLIVVLLCLITVVFVTIGGVILQGALLWRRYEALQEELPIIQIIRKWKIPCRSTFLVTNSDYNAYLEIDESMLKALYSVYNFQQFLFGPVHLIFKALTIGAVVGTTSQSLTQLTLVSILEVVFAFVLVFLSPYKNVWIEAVCRFSAIHQITMLALTSLNRVALANGTSDYGPQMILAFAVYIGVVFVIGMGIVFSPVFARVCLRDSVETQLEKELEEEDRKKAEEKLARKKAELEKTRYKDMSGEAENAAP